MTSSDELLALHALRLKGHGGSNRLAARFGLDPELVDELMQDFEAYGWVSRVGLPGLPSWSLTGAGKAANERMLAEQLDASGGRGAVVEAHRAFLPLNARLQKACTDWQLRPTRSDSMAMNDHGDFAWDDRILGELRTLAGRLVRIEAQLAAALDRFAGYQKRYVAALTRAEAGQWVWVDGVGIDSVHAVWFELHEDLLATLGIERGSKGA